MFDAADTDNGGKISFLEFVTAVHDANNSAAAGDKEIHVSDAKDTDKEGKTSGSLSSGLAKVVLRAEVAQLQSEAIGRFFLVVFLWCSNNAFVDLFGLFFSAQLTKSFSVC